MKFKVTLKDPDGVYESIEDAAKSAANEVAGVLELDDEDRASFVERKTEKLKKLCSKWFEYGEYLTVEIDTEAETCVVVLRGGAAMNELKAAVREQRDEIERIAAGLVRAGIPLWAAMERAWEIYRKRKARAELSELRRKDSNDGPSDNNSRLGRSLREGTDT